MTFTRDHLAAVLLAIHRAEQAGDYLKRFDRILNAMHLARKAGLDVGLAYDHRQDGRQDQPELEGRRIIAYIELGEPYGQVSWHLAESGIVWDGHSTEEKYERIRRYARDRGGSRG